jgi:hypothetical protein
MFDTTKFPSKKSAGEISGGSFSSPNVQSPYAFMFAFTASAVIGSARMRAPQALKMGVAQCGGDHRHRRFAEMRRRRHSPAIAHFPIMKGTR